MREDFLVSRFELYTGFLNESQTTGAPSSVETPCFRLTGQPISCNSKREGEMPVIKPAGTTDSETPVWAIY